MIKLCEPEIPRIYWVNHFTYECENCGSIFKIMFPNGNDLIKFEEINGDDIKWLPTYGKGGYLDLIKKLIPSYSNNLEITMNESRLFIKELNKYAEKGINGNGFDFSYLKNECKNCKSKEIKILSEEVLVKPKLSWLEISCDLINQ